MRLIKNLHKVLIFNLITVTLRNNTKLFLGTFTVETSVSTKGQLYFRMINLLP